MAIAMYLHFKIHTLNTKTVAKIVPKMRWAFRRAILLIIAQYIWTKTSYKTKNFDVSTERLKIP